MAVVGDTCCTGCCESVENKECETCHELHCDMNIICNITKPKQKHNDHPFWRLFSDRKYRTIHQNEVRNLIIEILYIDFQKIINDDELNGLLITDFKKQYESKKIELMMDTENTNLIGQLETFFNHYEYGDGIDIHGYRGTGLYLIGYTHKNMHLNKNNNHKLIGNKSELRFIKTWSEYGYGRPLEFFDAPMDYFGDCENEYRLFDPIRWKMNINIESKQNKDKIEETETDDEYDPYQTFYKLLMDDIKKRKLNPSNENYIWGDKEIDLEKFPDEYITIYTGWEGSFDYMLRDKVEKLFEHDDGDTLVDEWTYLYDKAVNNRKIRIEMHITECLKHQFGNDIITCFLQFII
eukprot:199241_1